MGCGIRQAISHQPLLTVHATLITVPSQGNSCRIFGGQSGNVNSFSLCSIVSSCQYLSTNFPHYLYSSFPRAFLLRNKSGAPEANHFLQARRWRFSASERQTYVFWSAPVFKWSLTRELSFLCFCTRK